MFTNSKPTLCPVTGCTLKQSDCVTDLVSPYDTEITVETRTPWIINVRARVLLGYPAQTVCYSCSNKDSVANTAEQTITKQISVRQQIKCTEALSLTYGLPLLKDYTNPIAAGGYAAHSYAPSPKYHQLPQTVSSINLFYNVYSADCGGFTSCTLHPQGCGSGTYSGRAILTTPNYGIMVEQDVDIGYTETLCVKCQNSVGAVTQKDDWVIT